MKKKNRLNLVAFSLNGFLFLLGGIDLINEGKIVLGTLQLVASIPNFSMIAKVRNRKIMEKLNYVVLVMNVIVCISVGIDYILANTSYLQYVWFLAAIVSLLALFLQRRKQKATLGNGSEK